MQLPVMMKKKVGRVLWYLKTKVIEEARSSMVELSAGNANSHIARKGVKSQGSVASRDLVTVIWYL